METGEKVDILMERVDGLTALILELTKEVKKNNKEKEIFDKKDTIEYLRKNGKAISSTTLWRLMKNGELVGQHESGYDGRIGGRPFFRKATLDAYLESITRV